MQQAEEAAAEAEAERGRGLGLVEERGVVELEPLERVAKLRVLVGVGREEAGEHHRLDVLVAGQRLARGTLDGRERVADAQERDVLQPGDDVADLAGGERLDGRHRRREEAELLRVEARAGGHRPQPLARRERAVDHADERDDAAVLVVRGVEDERAGGGVAVAGGRRDALDDRVEHLPDSIARLRRDAQDARRVVAEQVGDLDRRAVGVGRGRSILFTTGTISSPFSIARYALASVCASIPCAASTTRSAPSHAWSERDTSYVKSTCPGVSMRLSSCPFHETRTACALIVMPRSRSRSIESSSWARMSRADDRLGDLEDAVGERRLAVVDVRDDREVADAALVHPVGDGTEGVVRGRRGPASWRRRGQTAPPPRVGSLSLRPRDRRYRRIGVEAVATLSQLSGNIAGRDGCRAGGASLSLPATRPSRTRRATRARARTSAPGLGR